MFPPAPPWKARRPGELDREYLVFSSRFSLGSVRRVPALLAFSWRIGKRANAAAGIICWSLAPDLSKLEFHTLSVWDERKRLSVFLTTSPLREAMGEFSGDLRRPTLFVEYTIFGRDLPVTWADTVRHQVARSK